MKSVKEEAMKYFVIDVGGSSVKYAVMNENREILAKSSAASRHLETPEQFVSLISQLYRDNGSCEGGIAVSYCGELNEKTGEIHHGGSYQFLTGRNLKEMLEEECGVRVSIENDGNCAGLAELKYGSLQGCRNAAVAVIGTGVGGALIINGELYRGTHGHAGSLSLLSRSIETEYTKQSWAFRVAGADSLCRRYEKAKGLAEKSTDGFFLFDAAEKGDPEALNALKDYSSTLANLLFDLHLVLDLEAIAIGGGMSRQKLLQFAVRTAFESIYQQPGMEKLHLPKPEIRICQYFNEANLIGALCHHLEDE